MFVSDEICVSFANSSAGVCPKGHFCPEGSTIPTPCKEGHFCGQEGLGDVEVNIEE